MPNTQGQFNPAYSTIKSIQLGSLNITRQNTECIFEKLELVENVNDVFPNGVLIVKDFKDIISYIKINKIEKIYVTFFNGNVWEMDITAVSYINNAASDTEENFVGIYLSNLYYKKVQKSSLIKTLGITKPQVYLINEFVDLLKQSSFNNAGGFSDPTTNYVVYKPLNTLHERQQSVADNPIEYLNYLASSAVGDIHAGLDYGTPQFMFWTEFDGSVNFKYFHRNPNDDDSAADPVKVGIYTGDAVIQKLSDGKVYRKAYYLNTNPGIQFISKNYYYIKKTPKLLDSIPTGISGGDVDAYNTSCLSYQFQDEGQKYNIEIIDADGLQQAVPGADQLIYDNHWGYYDGLESLNDSSYHAHMGQQFGTEKTYSNLNFMGASQYMPYVDNTEMWKNMFDMTEVHPHYPDAQTFSTSVPGQDTKLQKIIDIRYNTFLSTINDTDERLKKIREIELQNFIMYSLCCMGKKNDEECFFAALLKYEEDNNCSEGNSVGKKYRYKWNKLIFDGPTGASGSTSNPGSCGGCGGSGASGGSCSIDYFYQIEKWSYDSLKSSAVQDDTWAINLNERALGTGYIPPGYILDCVPAGFKMRPIGAKSKDILPSEDIFHVVKLCKHTENGQSVYHFSAENAFDGCCISGGTA
jgi:hypothetical protein